MVFIAVSKYVTTHKDLTTVSVLMGMSSTVMASRAQVRPMILLAVYILILYITCTVTFSHKFT